MPVALNEEDMLVVGKIQELKNTTIARAKEYYRKKVYAEKTGIPITILARMEK